MGVGGRLVGHRCAEQWGIEHWFGLGSRGRPWKSNRLSGSLLRPSSAPMAQAELSVKSSGGRASHWRVSPLCHQWRMLNCWPTASTCELPQVTTLATGCLSYGPQSCFDQVVLSLVWSAECRILAVVCQVTVAVGAHWRCTWHILTSSLAVRGSNCTWLKLSAVWAHGRVLWLWLQLAM